MALAIAGWTFACTGPREEPPANNLQVHQFVAPGTATLGIGEDCAAGGRSACTTGACVHYGPQNDRFWVCSVTCSSALGCPVSWECVALMPGAQSDCFPPSSWQPHLTQVRATPAAVPSAMDAGH